MWIENFSSFSCTFSTLKSVKISESIIFERYNEITLVMLLYNLNNRFETVSKWSDYKIDHAFSPMEAILTVYVI